jgi:hypothetical protein
MSLIDIKVRPAHVFNQAQKKSVQRLLIKDRLEKAADFLIFYAASLYAIRQSSASLY